MNPIATCCSAFRIVLLSILLVLIGVTAAHAQIDPFTKVFSPNEIGPGSVSMLTFTITNTAGTPADDLAFTDVLPTTPGTMTIATPAAVQNTCDGTVTAPDGGSTISLTGGKLGAGPGTSCTITVNVTAGAVDNSDTNYTNTTGTLTATINGDGASLGTATDDLLVDIDRPGFSKSFAPSSVPLGGRSTLTFTIDNTANASNVNELDFTDNLPTGMVIADPSNASTTCGTVTIPPTLTADAGTSVIVLDANGIGSFPAVEDGATCTVTVEVVATGGGALDNVSDNLLASFVEAGKASATLEVTVTSIALRKAFTDDPVPPGGTVTLEFIIDNFERDFPATGVAFTDDLTTALAGLTFSSLLSNDCGGDVSGAGTSTITFTGGTVAPEGSCTIRTSLTVPAGAAPGIYTNTSGAVSGTVGGAPVTGNTASDDLFVSPVPVLTKLFVGDPVLPGDDVTLRFTIKNTSATSGATDITFADELTDGGPGTGFLPFPVPVTLPPVPDPPCGAGSSLALVFVDTDRQALQLTGGSLAAAGMAGDSCTFEVTVTIPDNFEPGTYLNTTEEITATVDGATRTGRPASDDLVVIAAPSLTKAFTDDPAAPGGTVTLEFTLTHSPDASGDATAITFTDDLAALTPALAGLTATGLPLSDVCGPGNGTLTGSAGDTNLTFMGGTLMPGESCTFSVTLDVPAGAAPGSYTNTTSKVGATVDGLMTTSAAASDVLAVQGLIFTKEFLDDPHVPGDTGTLRFTIQNVHPTDDATITFFTDNLAAALPGLASTGAPTTDTCGGTLSAPSTFIFYTGGSVMSGQTCIIEVPVLVPAGAADGTYTNITSSLSATQGGGGVVIDPARDELVVNSNLLGLAKAFTDDPVAPGGTVTLEFTLTNLDAANPASGVGFTDDLASVLPGTPDLTFDSVLLDDCGGTVSGTGTTMITVSGVSLGIGGTCTLRTSLTVPGASAPNVYTNTTSAVTGTIGGFAVNGDPASDELEVINLLLFSKAFDGSTLPGGTATLTFTITNPGSAAATGLAFSDDLNAVIPGLVATGLPKSDVCGPGSTISGTSSLAFTGGEVAPSGGTCSFDVTVQVPAEAAPGTYPNTTSNLTASGLKVANPATADLVVEPPPTFAKVFGPNPIPFQGTSTLTFTIDNSASGLAATSLDFTDNLPANVEVASPSNATTDCTGGTLTATAGTSVISYTGGTVGATASCTVSVDVKGTLGGTFTNLTGDLTSSSGNSGTATDVLTVVGPLDFTKVFTPGTIGPGSVAMLTFTINNPEATGATGLAFTDNLPAGVKIAAPAAVVNECGGTVTAPDGGTTVSLADGQVPTGASCTIMVNVTSSTPGTHTNTTSSLSSNFGDNSPATADLTVATTLPGFTKVFSPSTVSLGGRSTLTFTIDNSANASKVESLVFTDNLPPGMVIAGPANASTDCGNPSLPATLTATSGTSVINLSALGLLPGFPALDAGATCTVTVDVVGSAIGPLGNVSGELIIDLDDDTSAGKASAVLTVSPVSDAIFLAKDFTDDPAAPGGTVTLEFTITNRDRTFPATDIDFSDPIDPLGALTGLAPGETLPKAACGGMLDFAAGALSFTGGSLGAEGSCTFSVVLDVPGTAPTGTFLNMTDAITAVIDGDGVTGNMATDDLFVSPAPKLTKLFVGDPVGTGDDVTLQFTIENTSPTWGATDIAFIDELTTFLPFPVSVTLPPTPNPPCGGSSSLALVSCGTDCEALSLTGGDLAASGMCTFDVTLTIPVGLAAGTYTNTTEEITATVDAATVTGDPATDDLVVVAAPSLVKEFTDDPVLPGGTVTLEFTLTNDDADNAASAIAFSDDLDAVITGLQATAATTNTCGGMATSTFPTGLFEYAAGSLDPGASCEITLTLDVPAGAPPGSHTNTTSEVTATVSGTTATGLPAEDDLIIASLLFSKEFIDDPIIPGGTGTLRFTIDNVGAGDATGIFFTDDLNAVVAGLTAVAPLPTDPCGTGSSITGTTFLTLTGGNLTGGTSCTFDVTVMVPAAAVPDTYNNVTSSLTATIGGSGVTIDPARDELVVQGNLLQLTKAFTDDPVLPGGNVTLKFTLTNLDGSNPASDIEFSDNLDATLAGLKATAATTNTCGGMATSMFPAGLFEYAGGMLGAGGSCEITLTLSVPAGAANGTYPNTTSGVTGTINSLAVTGDPGTDNLIVSNTPVAFSKSFDGPTTATGTAVLTFTIVNGNPTIAITDLGFTDNLDAVISGLAAVAPLPTAPCGAGSTLSGTSSLALTGGNLAGGATCTFDVTVQVPGTATTGTFTNTTSALSQIGLPVADPATAELTIEPPPTFAKVFAPDAILIQGTSTLTFTIDNSASALAATSLDFTDNLPAGVEVTDPSNATTDCTGGTLTADAGTGVINYTGGSVAAGASCTLSVDVKATAGGTHTNVTGDLTSSSGNSGTATDDLTVENPPNLTVTKADALVIDGDGDGKADPGDTIEYTVVITNTGGGAAGVVFTDAAAAHPNTTLVVGSVTTTEGTITSGNSGGPPPDADVSVSVGTLAESGMVTITFRVTVDDPQPAGDEQVCNQGTTSGSNFASVASDDPETGDPNDATCTTVDAAPDLVLTKDDGGVTAMPGDDVPYTLTYRNTGNQDAINVEMVDIVPANTTFNPTASTAGWVCFPDGSAGSTCTLSIGAVGAGAAPATATFTVTVDDPVSAGTVLLTNTASVADDGAGGPDQNPPDNTATDDTPIDATPQVDATKSDALAVDTNSNGLVDPGDTIEYTIEISNTGNEGAATVVLTDTPGANTALVVGSVAAPGGTIVTGNTPGDTMVEVQFDEIAGEPGVVGTGTVTFRVTVDSPFPNTVEKVFNQGSVAFVDGAGLLLATILTDDPDTPAPDDPTATVINRTSDLALTKTVDNPTPPIFSNVVFTLTLTNLGPVSNGIIVRDLLPDGLTFISADPAVDYKAPTGLWKVDNLDPGDVRVLQITARIDVATPRTNEAEVFETLFPDPDLSNNTASATVTPTPLFKSEGDRALVQELDADVPTEYELGPNYPNPFNPETVVPIGVPEAGTVALHVYDLLGRRVATLFEGTLSPGRYQVTWQAENQPTGLYLVRMRAGDFVQTRRVTLLK